MSAADQHAVIGRWFLRVARNGIADPTDDQFAVLLAAARLVALHRANPDAHPAGPIAAYGNDAPDDVRLAADLWAGDDPDLYLIVAGILRRCKAERVYPDHDAVMLAAALILDHYADPTGAPA